MQQAVTDPVLMVSFLELSKLLVLFRNFRNILLPVLYHMVFQFN